MNLLSKEFSFYELVDYLAIRRFIEGLNVMQKLYNDGELVHKVGLTASLDGDDYYSDVDTVFSMMSGKFWSELDMDMMGERRYFK